MNIYELGLYYDQGELYREYSCPKDLDRMRASFPPLFLRELFFYKYLVLNPKKYKDYELEVYEKTSDKRLDVEKVHGDMYCVSERFKQFAEREQIPFDFFPVKVEGQRRYLMMWRRLPVISDYEVDVERSDYLKNGALDEGDCVFRSDILEYLRLHIFNLPSRIGIYVTDALKEKLECEGFLFGYREREITARKLDPKQVEKDLLFARQKEREVNLTKWFWQKLQEVDEYLEKVLIEEGEQEALEKFRSEMKGVWKRDFERYEQGLMAPQERITFW